MHFCVWMCFQSILQYISWMLVDSLFLNRDFLSEQIYADSGVCMFATSHLHLLPILLHPASFRTKVVLSITVSQSSYSWFPALSSFVFFFFFFLVLSWGSEGGCWATAFTAHMHTHSISHSLHCFCNNCRILTWKISLQKMIV